MLSLWLSAAVWGWHLPGAGTLLGCMHLVAVWGAGAVAPPAQLSPPFWAKLSSQLWFHFDFKVIRKKWVSLRHLLKSPHSALQIKETLHLSNPIEYCRIHQIQLIVAEFVFNLSCYWACFRQDDNWCLSSTWCFTFSLCVHISMHGHCLC